MSCLSVSVSRVSNSLKSNITRIGEPIKFNISLAKRQLKAIASNACTSLKVRTSRIGGGITTRCSIVCSLSEFTKWLSVSPEQVQWITDDVGIFYDVRSNVEWIINID